MGGSVVWGGTAIPEVDKLIGEMTRLNPARRPDIRGFFCLQTGDYEKGLNECLQARRMNPDLDQDNLKLANLFFYHHEKTILPQMERLKNGLSAGPCHEIAMAYHNTGFYPHAASYFQLALSVADPSGLAQLYNNLSGSYLGAGLFIEAFQAGAKAIILDSDLDKTNYLYSLSQIKGMNLNPVSFTPVLPASEESLPKEDTSEALEHYFSRNYTAALEQFNRLIETSHDQDGAEVKGGPLPGYLNHKAMCHLNQLDFDKAVSDCLEARKSDPGLGHENLRLAQFFQKEYETSLSPVFEKLNSEINADHYNQIGLIYFKNNFFSQAATYFQLAGSVSEGLVKAESYNNLAGAYLESGFFIEGLRAAATAVGLNPRIHKINYNLASLQLKPMGLNRDLLLRDRFFKNRGFH